MLTNDNGTATHFVLAPDFNPATAVSQTCDGIRAVLDKYNDPANFEFYLRNRVLQVLCFSSLIRNRGRK